MHKAALTVNSIPKVPARIQQLFPRPPQSAKSFGGQINENFPLEKFSSEVSEKGQSYP
jgi:hypothetical protein